MISPFAQSIFVCVLLLFYTAAVLADTQPVCCFTAQPPNQDAEEFKDFRAPPTKVT